MNKNNAISYCRIIGMVFIVICHIVKYYTFIPGHAFLGQFFNVGVEMFLLISGMLYGSRTEANWKMFFRKRYEKILIPVQIWTVIMFFCVTTKDVKAFFVYFLGLKGLENIHEIFQFDISQMGMSHTWFITIILFCYLMVPLLQRLRGKILATKFIYIVYGAWILTIILSFASIRVHYFALFVTGYYIGTKGLDKKLSSGKIALKLCVIALAFITGRVVLKHAFEDSVFYGYTYVPLCMSVVAFAIISILFTIYQAKRVWLDKVAETKIFNVFEGMTYYIFIVHWCMVENPERNIFINNNLMKASLLFFLFTLVIAAAFYWVEKKISGLRKKS